MGLELANFGVDAKGPQQSAFHFEVIFTGTSDQPQCVYRGEGILFGGGRLLINHEHDLADAVACAGLNPQQFLNQLAQWVEAQFHPRSRGYILGAAARLPDLPA